MVAGSTREFDIDDRPETPLSISLDTGGVTLEVDSTSEIEIDVEVDGPVSETRWDEVEQDGDGVLRVDQSSDQIDSMRSKLREGLEIN